MNILMHRLGERDVSAQIPAKMKKRNPQIHKKKKHGPSPHVVSKLLPEGAEGQESRCISFLRCTQSFYFPLSSSKQLQPLVLFKCFLTPENADGAADHTAAAELVIRTVFGSQQPPGLSVGSPSAASSVATLRHCWLRPP